MYTDYLMQRSSASVGLRAGLMAGGNVIFQNYKTGLDDNYANYTSGAEIFSADRIAQNRVYGPLAIHLKPVKLSLYNGDTMEYSAVSEASHFGGRLIGDFDNLLLPVSDISRPTVIGDLMGSMLIGAVDGQLSLAYSYLRSAQLFDSMNDSVQPISMVQSEDDRTVTKIKLHRI